MSKEQGSYKERVEALKSKIQNASSKLFSIKAVEDLCESSLNIMIAGTITHIKEICWMYPKIGCRIELNGTNPKTILDHEDQLPDIFPLIEKFIPPGIIKCSIVVSESSIHIFPDLTFELFIYFRDSTFEIHYINGITDVRAQFEYFSEVPTAVIESFRNTVFDFLESRMTTIIEKVIPDSEKGNK